MNGGIRAGIAPGLGAGVGAGASGAGLFVAMIGDSNAVGIGDTDRADKIDPGGGAITVPFTDCTYNSRQASAVADPPVWLDLATGSLRPYAAGGQSGMGFELTLGRTLAAAGAAPWLAKQAITGATLHVEWKPSGTFPTGTNLYRQWVARMHDLETTSGRRLAAVVVSLGTNDAADTTQASAFQANMAAFRAAVTADFGAATPIVWIKTNTNTTNTFTSTVRTGQVAAAADSSIILVDNDDLSLTDGLHYESDGYLTLGQRVGFAILDRLGYARQTAGPVSSVVGWGPAAYGAGALSPRSWPGAKANDREYMVVVTGLTDVAITTPAGWSLIAGTSQTSTFAVTNKQRMAVYERLVTQAMLDANAGRTAPTTVADTNDLNAAKIFCVRATTPTTDVANSGANNALDQALTQPTITTTVANELVMLFSGGFSGNGTASLTTTHAGLTSVTRHQNATYLIGSDFQNIGLTAGVKLTAGATGTGSVAASNNMILVGAVIGVKPS
jgi:hypothetical protein